MLLAVARGDRDAFRQLATRYAARLSAFCARQMNDSTLGDDFSQDVLVAAWEARTQFRGGNAAAWLFTLALNRCRKHRRGAFRLLTAQLKISSTPESGAVGPLETVEQRQLMLKATRALSERLPNVSATTTARCSAALSSSMPTMMPRERPRSSRRRSAAQWSSCSPSSMMIRRGCFQHSSIGPWCRRRARGFHRLSDQRHQEPCAAAEGIRSRARRHDVSGLCGAL